MSAPPTGDELRDLHDSYTWEVNAAVGRGEDRLVDRLSEEYLDRALGLLTGRSR